jgi:hypothetical protein
MDGTEDPTIQQVELKFTDQELGIEDVLMLQDVEIKQYATENITEQDEEIASMSEQQISKETAAARPRQQNTVSGLYVSKGGGGQFECHLRIDVDSRTPLRKVSGDFYQISGNTVTYFGSFIVDTITLRATNSQIIIEGIGAYTWNTGTPKIRIIIRRTFDFQPRAPAVLQFFAISDQPGATYRCQFRSVYFRTIEFEQDSETGVIPFVSYNTGSLPSGGQSRILSIPSAYGEAGIEFRVSTATNQIDNSGAGPDTVWSDRELHDVMTRHFSIWREEAQWKVWLLAASEHELGTGLYGIMFDQIGKQRQGCATFHRGIGGTTADQQRLQIYTYVHELGHCFNLLHSWQKSFAVPPSPNRPNALSWMNYPWNFPSGPGAFWNSFNFTFDGLELRHLRHGFRNNVIMGGNDFIAGSALTSINDPQAYAVPVEDNSGLQLTLKTTKESYQLGMPVEIEVKLSTTTTSDKPVIADINPRFGFVQLAIRDPNSHINQWGPMMQHCIKPTITKLGPKKPALYESVYIGFSKMEGVVFAQPGTYYVRGIYSAHDGSQVVSNILPLIVTGPVSATDQKIAQLLNGLQQTQLLHLAGSYSPFLSEGNEAFDQVLNEHPNDTRAPYVEFVQGIRAGRAFKTITEEGNITLLHKADPKKSIDLLSFTVEKKDKAKALGNITLFDAMRYLAVQQKSIGDKKGAKSTLDQILGTLSKDIKNEFVLEHIEEQANRALELDVSKVTASMYRHA